MRKDYQISDDGLPQLQWLLQSSDQDLLDQVLEKLA
jgi:hypothetical protein